ncbi:MAG: type II secretion system F family protein [Culicoidibacterales bacterium]
MAKFKYRAKTLAGEKVDGIFEAATEHDVMTMITANGYYPLVVEKIVESPDIALGKLDSVKLEDVAIFCRQFYTMLNAGVTLNVALGILGEELPKKAMRQATLRLLERISKGESLSQAMAKEEKVFPSLLVSMVEVGETTGNLDTVMLRMANQYVKDNKINKKIKSTMIYPVILAIVAVSVVIFLLTYILPTFLTIFTDNGVAIPWTTQLLIAISDFLLGNAVILVIVGVLGTILLTIFGRTEKGKEFFAHIKLKMPIFKALNQKIIVARFTRTMSILTASGIPIMQALDLTATVIKNVLIERKIIAIREAVARGESLAEAVKTSEAFPSMLASMVKIGEETGAIDEILDKTADFYEEELEHQMQVTVSLVEPIMILVMAAIIGFIIIAIMTPMFEMYSVM